LLFLKKDSVNLLEDNSAPVGPDEKENKHAPRITRKTYLKMERVKRLYMRQLEGLTANQLVLDHAKKEQVSEETAWRDWREVAKLNDEDFARERETMGARIFALRQKVFNAAMRRGQMNTAAQVLDSLARQVGCDEPQSTEMLPEIRVRVEPPAPIAGTTPTQLPAIDVTETEDVENA
jgi:hypothetical protein|tara:strand:- start:12346 stop:12879 length:534 start_codon:yes stop_codon:yes gene_type:complete